MVELLNLELGEYGSLRNPPPGSARAIFVLKRTVRFCGITLRVINVSCFCDVLSLPAFSENKKDKEFCARN